MLKIEKTAISGWEAALRGMRNPKNSWNRSDTAYDTDSVPTIGPNDMQLMRTLIASGTDHRKFLRMIHVSMDVTAPLYWYKEFDVYRIGVTENSCSTMHKIHSRDLARDDFSTEHLMDSTFTGEIIPTSVFDGLVKCINQNRRNFVETKNKRFWWQMIQLLGTSFNQKRTIDINYEVLVRMYFARRDHKLDEWHTFCDWLLDLPYMKDILRACLLITPNKFASMSGFYVAMNSDGSWNIFDAEPTKVTDGWISNASVKSRMTIPARVTRNFLYNGTWEKSLCKPVFSEDRLYEED